MKCTVGASRLLILAVTLTTVLLLAAPLVAEGAARQFCSPLGGLCFGPLDCCSGQCFNGVCCDEYLGTCPFDYLGGPYWKRDSSAITTTVTTPETEGSSTTTTTESVTPSEEKPDEAVTRILGRP
ncbi:uncharacterized protein LOC119178299 [Rhipicephalus microplus]|uniref:uncharacterized protein LOC119178299 n=1 Tax=Rhipicephalus microplus TaxID=6941 RepID=UPI003F6A6969